MNVEQLQALDFSILYWIQDHLRCPLLDAVMPRLTLLGEMGMIWILLALVMIFWKRHRRGGIALAVGLLCSLLVGNLLLKPLAARPRPCWLDPSIQLLVELPRDFSFPSGHTLSGIIAATVLLRYDKRFGIPALILALLIAFSRLYLFLHFPSDVAAAILLGIPIGLAAGLLTERYCRRGDWV